MYITFREPERLYSVQNVPGTVIHHIIEVRKLNSGESLQLSTLLRGTENSLTLHLVNQRIIGTTPEKNQQRPPHLKQNGFTIALLSIKSHHYRLLIYFP